MSCSNHLPAIEEERTVETAFGDVTEFGEQMAVHVEVPPRLPSSSMTNRISPTPCPVALSGFQRVLRSARLETRPCFQRCDRPSRRRSGATPSPARGQSQTRQRYQKHGRGARGSRSEGAVNGASSYYIHFASDARLVSSEVVESGPVSYRQPS